MLITGLKSYWKEITAKEMLQNIVNALSKKQLTKSFISWKVFETDQNKPNARHICIVSRFGKHIEPKINIQWCVQKKVLKIMCYVISVEKECKPS